MKDSHFICHYPTGKDPSVALEVSAELLCLKFSLVLLCIQGRNVSHIKLMCKLFICTRGALKFSAQSPNYAGVLDEIVYFFQSGVVMSHCKVGQFSMKFYQCA